jgi:hypothetical protein
MMICFFFIKKKTKQSPDDSLFVLISCSVFPYILYTSFILYDFSLIHLSFCLVISLFGGQHSLWCCCCYCCHYLTCLSSTHSSFDIRLYFLFIYFLSYHHYHRYSGREKRKIVCERAHLSGVVALSIFCTFK